jgi:hypothetical protein
VAAAVAVTLWQAPDAFRHVEGEIRAGEGLTRAQRELAPARSVDMATELFEAAAKTIPPRSTYLFLSGPGAGSENPLTIAKAPIFAGMYLLPRRQVTEEALADWVVSYGGDLGATGLRYSRTIEVLPGLQLAEVQR